MPLRIGLVVAFFFFAPFASRAGDDDWVSLFNGKDPTGWKLHGGEKLYVHDGAIVCESTTKKYAYLVTKKTYRDFNLQLRVKAEKGVTAASSSARHSTARKSAESSLR